MSLNKKVGLFFFACAVAACLYVVGVNIVYAGDECRGNCRSDSGGDVEVDVDVGVDGGSGGMGGAGGDGGDGGMGGAGGTGGSVGDLSAHSGSDATGGNSTVRSENRQIYLGAARDTADCFTKIQVGADGFGVGFSRSDAYCKKVRRIQFFIDHERFVPAARLECTLVEWKKVYGKDKERCHDELYVGPGTFADPTPIVVASDDRYEEIRKALRASEEEREQVEYRQSQQETLIESQAEALAKVRAEAIRLRKAEEARKAAEAAAKAKFKARLASKEQPNE